MNSLSQKTKGKKKEATLKEKKVLEIFNRFHKMNEHKMKPVPVCLIPNKLKTGKGKRRAGNL